MAVFFLMNLCFNYLIVSASFYLTSSLQMLSSLARYLESLPDEEGEPFLTQIQSLFHTDFIAKQQQESAESLNTSSRPVDSDDLPFDQLMSEERPQTGDSDQDSGRASDSSVQPTTQTTTSDTNSNTVLHLGSVLSPEHDYLLWWTIYLYFYCTILLFFISVVL